MGKHDFDDIKGVDTKFNDWEHMEFDRWKETMYDTPTMDRAFILREAEEIVCNDREGQYGSPEDNFALIANLWDAYLSEHPEYYPISPKDVAVMMCLMKIARIKTGKPKADSWVDAIGYLACGAELELRE